MKYGSWYPQLNGYTKTQVHTVFDGLLVIAFWQKTTGLNSNPELACVIQPPKNGYKIIYALALYANHPALQQFPIIDSFPRQMSDMTLSQYIRVWHQYLQRQVLEGKHYNERYFYQEFHQNMHYYSRVFGDELRIQVDWHPFQRLSSYFSVSNLASKMLEIARYLNRVDDYLKTPRELSRP